MRATIEFFSANSQSCHTHIYFALSLQTTDAQGELSVEMTTPLVFISSLDKVESK